MPVKAVKRGGRWRVVEAATGRLATNAKGTPVDGGGHASASKAKAQAAAINASLHRRRKG